VTPRPKFRLVFFDNDGTLNTYRSFFEYFHRHFGTWEPEGREILDHHMTERTPYDEFCRESVLLWKGFPKDGFLERMRTIEIRDQAPEIIRELTGAGVKIAVLSSGLTLWRDMWMEREGISFDHYHANDLKFDENGVCTGEIEMHVTDNVPGMEKGSWVERIAEIEGVPREERIFIGDGWGDVGGFRMCAYGVAIDPNLDEVSKAARYILGPNEFGKLRGILFN
jgi:HAD superfamily phosphoserine phosphatase-like hydrolase